MIFWLLSAALAAITALVILWPVSRTLPKEASREISALEVFKDQLAEVDRDADRGLISPQDAQAARTEIKRRMIAAGIASEKPDGTRMGSVLPLVLAATLVPVAGALVYLSTGSPGVPSLPFAERQQETEANREVVLLAERLRTRLEQDPDGGEAQGWELLGVTYQRMGRMADAVYAFEQLVIRDDATSGDFSRYAEALISVEGGVITPAAQKAIEQAQALDPLNPGAIYYAALALDQAGQALEARKLLLDRIANAAQPAPWMESFLVQANSIGERFALDPLTLADFSQFAVNAPAAGPTAEDMEAAAALSPEERMEFIKSMVEGLATRLQDEPDDLDGWLQLARARVVLGEREAAYTALIEAKRLSDELPEEDPRRLSVEAGLNELQ
ncbi:MAG: c-type cytochrome biogenesis protein CcmI [Pseudomonadota bacterium]